MPAEITVPSVPEVKGLVSVQDVGVGTGAVLTLAMVVAFVYNKLRASNSASSAESGLYDNLKDHVTKLTERLEHLEDDRDKWQAKAVELEGKVKNLERLEAENTKLITRLDAKDELLRVKDEQIASLLQEASLKSAQISNLTEKVHDLELKVARLGTNECQTCMRNH